VRLLRDTDLASAELVAPDDAATATRGRGRRLPATMATIYIRNALLVEMAKLFHRGASNHAAAAAIRKRLALYRAGAWRRHCAEETLPAALVGKIEELLWFVLKQRDAVPSERTIRAALDAAKKRSIAILRIRCQHKPSRWSANRE
jgi:hypothetical protein